MTTYRAWDVIISIHTRYFFLFFLYWIIIYNQLQVHSNNNSTLWRRIGGLRRRRKMADASTTIYRQVFFSFFFFFLFINGVFRYYWNFDILNDDERPELLPSMRDRMKKAFAECYRAVRPILGCDDGSAGSARRHSELFQELRYVHSSGQSTCWMLIVSQFLGISQLFYIS